MRLLLPPPQFLCSGPTMRTTTPPPPAMTRRRTSWRNADRGITSTIAFIVVVLGTDFCAMLSGKGNNNGFCYQVEAKKLRGGGGGPAGSAATDGGMEVLLGLSNMNNHVIRLGRETIMTHQEEDHDDKEDHSSVWSFNFARRLQDEQPGPSAPPSTTTAEISQPLMSGTPIGSPTAGPSLPTSAAPMAGDSASAGRNNDGNKNATSNDNPVQTLPLPEESALACAVPQWSTTVSVTNNGVGGGGDNQEDSGSTSSTPGVTALEYLGTGYHIFQGNPRGGEVTEVDPGFRSGVIKLVVDPNMKTQNGEFVVPLGTDLRYITACSFASSSVEVATTRDYTNELSKEASMDVSVSANGEGWGFTASAEFAFSESKKMRSFQNDREATQTTTFESKAFCTEFEGRLQKYYKHETKHSFNNAVAGLPTVFDKSNLEHRRLFGEFLSEYGTHYVSRVLLGAKQIYSFEMTTKDVLSLREEGNDISRSLSAKAAISYSGLGFAGGVSGEGGNNSTESKMSKELNAIIGKTQNIVETNVGGTPSSDGNWQTWAATAKDRPMPIQYELTQLSEVMDAAAAAAYGDFLEFYVANNLRSSGNGTFFEGLRGYGVAGPDGSAISSYTLDPRWKQRTITTFNTRDLGAQIKFAYKLMWDVASDRTSTPTQSAVFMTPVDDNLSPNNAETVEEPNVPLSATIVPFVLIEDSGTASKNDATIAVYGAKDKANLPIFSYLAAENLPQNPNVKVGVIHPQGYPINRVFGSSIGFNVSQSNDREWIVSFDPPFSKPPTLILSPLWISSFRGIYPDLDRALGGVRDLFVVSRGCDTTVCRVQAGNDRSSVPELNRQDRFLGFNFLAIDGRFTNDEAGDAAGMSLIHGFITYGREAPAGLVIIDNDQFRATKSDRLGAVLIEFKEKFEDIPAVIATADIGSEIITSEQYVATVAGVFVEHITTSQVLIRATLELYHETATFVLSLANDSNAFPLVRPPVSFNFVAVGPRAKT